MPQQLFLFDSEKKTVHDKELPAEGKELPLPNDTLINEDEKIMVDSEEDLNMITGEENNNNPFATIQQQQQDKIDTMLLMPNKKRGRKSFKDMDEESILIDVPEDDVLYKKQYYPISVVAEWFGITQSQLRMWETEFDILQPKKNRKGDRFFRPEDVKNLKLIYHLIRRRKFTLQGAKQYLSENKKNLQATLQLTESLQKFKQFLLELKAISG